MAVVIPIVTQYSDKGLQAALRSVKNAEGPMNKLSAATALIGPAAAAAGLAMGAFAIKMGVEGVQAAIEEEKELAKLTTTLQNLGFGAATDQVNGFIDAQARASTFSDSDLRPAFEKLALATGSVTEAQSLLTLAMDVAVGTGKDLDAVTAALAKAQNGNTTSLKRLLPALTDADLASANLLTASGALAQQFAGQSSAAADTWSGKLGNVTEAFDELKEAFGKGFLDGLSEAEGGTGSLTDTIYELQPALEEVGKALGTWISDLADLFREINNARQAFEEFRRTLENTPWGKIIDTIALSFERLTNPLKAVLELINGVKSAIASLQNVSVPTIPGLNQTRSFAIAGTGPSTRAAAPVINVTVNGAIDPVGTAKTIRRTLARADLRTGVGI